MRIRLWNLRFRAARDQAVDVVRRLARGQSGARRTDIKLCHFRRSHAPAHVPEEKQREAADAANVRGEAHADGARFHHGILFHCYDARWNHQETPEDPAQRRPGSALIARSRSDRRRPNSPSRDTADNNRIEGAGSEWKWNVVESAKPARGDLDEAEKPQLRVGCWRHFDS